MGSGWQPLGKAWLGDGQVDGPARVEGLVELEEPAVSVHHPLTPVSSAAVPEERALHVVPLVEVRRVPPEPTATLVRSADVPDGTTRHVAPSSEARIVPPSPTAT